MDEDQILNRVFGDRLEGRDAPYYSVVGNVFDALMYRKLLWPSAIEVEGALILRVGANTEEFVGTALREREKSPLLGRSWQEFVEGFNWFEVELLVGYHGGQFSRYENDALSCLAEWIAESWQAKLDRYYPSYDCSVVVVPPTGEDGFIISVRQQVRE